MTATVSVMVLRISVTALRDSRDNIAKNESFLVGTDYKFIKSIHKNQPSKLKV